MTQTIVFSQPEISHWYLGNGNGIDFSKNPPEVLNMAPQELGRYATISDNEGNLVFYCNNTTVWNANHQILENGTGLEGGLFEEMFILPKPGAKAEYYIFQVTSAVESTDKEVVYSIVDMSANNGIGKVVEKNVLLYRAIHGSLTFTVNCDSSFWVVGESDRNTIDEDDSDKILAFRATRDSIAHTPVVSAPVLIGSSGWLEFSPDGQKLVLIYNGEDRSGVVLADFNKQTGTVSNFEHIYECCESDFSPDGRFLYTVAEQNGIAELRQYDLVSSEHQRIATFPSGYFSVSSQLGPDGRLYFLMYDGFDRRLVAVNKPNEKGTACDFEFDSYFEFANELSPALLPEGYAHKLFYGPSKPDAGPDFEICQGEFIQIGGQEIPNDPFHWFPKVHLNDPFAANPIFQFNNTIAETVELTYRLTACESDLTRIIVHPTPSPEIDGSYSVCPGVEGVEYWTDYKAGYDYTWKIEGGTIVDGQGTNNIKVDWGPSNPDAKVKLIAENDFGCVSDEVVFDVRINVELETEQPGGPRKMCYNDRTEHEYSIRYTNGSTYLWEVSQGTITEGQGTNRVIVDWDDLGEHWIQVKEESITNDTICFGDSPRLPVLIYRDSLELMLNYITNDTSSYGQLILDGQVNNAKDFRNIKIFRKAYDELNWMEIDNITIIDDFLYVDSNLDSDKGSYQYFILLVDECGEEVVSPSHATIHLQAELLSENSIKLSWSPYKGWNDGVDQYQLFRKLDGDVGFDLLETFDSSINSCILDDPTSGFEHTYLVKAVNQKFYSWSNQASVEFDFLLNIPNAFTPNDDGVNEFFVFEYLDLYKPNQFTVYDRTGKVVYHKLNYNGEWNASGLSDGIYFYRFYEQINNRNFTGWIKVMR